MESAIAVAQAVFFPWVGGVGGGRERGEESRRQQAPGCAEPARLAHPQPLPPGGPPPSHPHSQSSACFLFGALNLANQGSRFTSLSPFQQHCPSHGGPLYHKIPPSPPSPPRPRRAPSRNWGSESKPSFLPQIYPGHIGVREMMLPCQMSPFRSWAYVEVHSRKKLLESGVKGSVSEGRLGQALCSRLRGP